MKLGDWPMMELAEARAAAAAGRHRVEMGEDPAAERRAEREPPPPPPDVITLTGAFGEYKRKKLDGMKSGRITARELQRHVIDVLGDRDITTITRRELIDLLDDIAETGRAVTANRTKAYLSAFFSWCEDRETIEMNPAARLKRLVKEESRDRVLTDTEIRIFLSACASVRAPWGHLGRLLLLTGQRLGEVAGMTDDEVNSDIWNIPSCRTKNGKPHDVPLTAAALSILAEVPRLNVDGKAGAYLFSTNGISPVSGFSKSRDMIAERMVEIASEAAGRPVEIPHWTYHDLRRTLATRLEGLGVPVNVTEAVLNHVSGSKSGVAGIYQRHQHVTEKRQALDMWAQELDRIAASG